MLAFALAVTVATGATGAVTDDAPAAVAVAPTETAADVVSDSAVPVPVPLPLTPAVVEPVEDLGHSHVIPLAHTAALMGAMRLSLSLRWPEAFAPLPPDRAWSAARENWRQAPEFHSDMPLIESDGDPWLVNGVGHGLFGSEVYLRTRRCGHGPLASFGAAAAASTIWEYGIESFHQRPSAVDLVWTPLSGLAFGELRYQLLRAFGHHRAVSAIVDPFGELQRALGTRC